MNTPAIEVRGLRKSYGEKVVLDDVDLTVGAGTVTALLGPNGAGKTTPCTSCPRSCGPTAARPSVNGCDVVRDPDGVRAAIGLTGQFSAVDNLLTGEENLLLMARLRHLGAKRSKTRVAELLEQFDLVDAARKPLATYSGGMRRRLDLAMTLVATPSVIFLDEPTTGLDPRSRHTMWDIVRGLVADGTTVLLTTQYLDEADELADRIAVLDGGRIVAEGTPDELKRLVPGGHIRLRFADAAALDAASRLLDESARDDAGLALTVPSDGGVGALRTVLDRLDAANLEVDDLSIHTPDLDDVFFALTGRADTKGTAVMTTITAQRPTAPGTSRQSHVVADAITMLRRNLLHMVRYPGLSVFTIVGPVVLLLLFVFVFGGTLGAGLPGADPAGGREAYVAYVMPGILLMTIAGSAGGTATTVAMDMTEGITARFRTMAISRAAVLAGHVLGNTIQAIIAVVARARRRPADRLPPDRRTDRVDRRRRPDRAHRVRDQLARGRDGHAGEVGRDGEQPAAPADLPALPRQRLRADRVDAGVDAVVRAVPAVHAVHRDHPRAAARHPARLEPGARDRVVRRDRGRRVRLVDGDLRAEVGALSPRLPR